MQFGMCGNTVAEYYLPLYGSGTAPNQYNAWSGFGQCSGVAVWHMFDTNAGLDTNGEGNY